MNYIVLLVPIILFLLGKDKNKFSARQKRLLRSDILVSIDQICDLLKLRYKRYIAAICLTESFGNEGVSGSSGEIGLMQIMPSTFQYLDNIYHFNFDLNDLWAIKPNIYVASTLFKHNLNHLNYDLFDTIKSYNVGVDLSPKDKATYYLKKVLNNAS